MQNQEVEGEWVRIVVALRRRRQRRKREEEKRGERSGLNLSRRVSRGGTCASARASERESACTYVPVEKKEEIDDDGDRVILVKNERTIA